LSADDIDLKYFAFSEAVLGPVRARQIADLVAQLGFSDTALAELMELTLSSTSPQAN